MVGSLSKSSLNPPHLKAMIPWEGLNDMYREIAFHGGIPDTGFIAFGFKVFSQDGQKS